MQSLSQAMFPMLKRPSAPRERERVASNGEQSNLQNNCSWRRRGRRGRPTRAIRCCNGSNRQCHRRRGRREVAVCGIEFERMSKSGGAGLAGDADSLKVSVSGDDAAFGGDSALEDAEAEQKCRCRARERMGVWTGEAETIALVRRRRDGGRLGVGVAGRDFGERAKASGQN